MHIIIIVDDTHSKQKTLFWKQTCIQIAGPIVLNPNFIWMPNVCHYGIWYTDNKKIPDENEVIRNIESEKAKIAILFRFLTNWVYILHYDGFC